MPECATRDYSEDTVDTGGNQDRSKVSARRNTTARHPWGTHGIVKGSTQVAMMERRKGKVALPLEVEEHPSREMSPEGTLAVREQIKEVALVTLPMD
jgi:hypothetical protein